MTTYLYHPFSPSLISKASKMLRISSGAFLCIRGLSQDASHLSRALRSQMPDINISFMPA